MAEFFFESSAIVENYYIESISNFFMSKYKATGNDSIAIFGSSIYADAWFADYWAEQFIAVSLVSENLDKCGYISMYLLLLNYANTINDDYLLELSEELVTQNGIPEEKYQTWMDSIEKTRDSLKEEDIVILLNKSWKSDYLNRRFEIEIKSRLGW